MPYGYKVRHREEKGENIRYTRQELEDMGTFMLRDICVREKISTRGASLNARAMDRDALIELLYRYRGRQDEKLLHAFPAESVEILDRIITKLTLLPDRFEAPFKLTVKKGIPLTASKGVKVLHGLEGETFCGVLADREGHVRAVFELEGQTLLLSPERMDAELETGLYYDWQMIVFDVASTGKIVKAYNEQVFSLPTARGIRAVKARLPVFALEEAGVVPGPLFIDFGTSSVCAAMADADGRLTFAENENGVLLPGCAAVRSCGPDGVEFLFGEEALSWVRRMGFGGEGTFLHNLKRFLFRELQLDVCDGGGNGARVSTDEILGAYLRYIINQVRSGFGAGFQEIRFLLPEKQEELALRRLRKILTEYRIESAGTETINCAYQEITGRLEDNDAGNGLPLLIFHCGGGATTLTGCHYSIENTQVAYELKMELKYLNGDSAFGGNNLTYLILKYLKNRLFCEITGRKDEILGDSFRDAYSLVDELGTDQPVYEEFDRLYGEAESVLPTRFDQADEFNACRKQNFFRLWFLAEQLKIRFARDGGRDVIRLPDGLEAYCNVNVYRDGRFQEYPIEMEIHRDEIWMVTAPVIYRTVKNFLEPYCNQDGILVGYHIKFTGLSCCIPVFRDAIREFTVGRRARVSGNDTLKIRAMKGAVSREQLLKDGRVIPQITHLPAAAAYTVTAPAHDGGSYRIVSPQSWENEVFGSVTRHVSTREVEFYVCDISGRKVRKRTVKLERDSFERTDYERLAGSFPMLRKVQGDIDSIGETDVRLFVFREENWDFCVLPIARREDGLYQAQVSRFLFDDISEDYFRGVY